MLELIRLSLLNSMHWPPLPELEAGSEDEVVEEDEEVAADTNFRTVHSLYMCFSAIVEKDYEGFWVDNNDCIGQEFPVFVYCNLFFTFGTISRASF